MDDLVTWLRAQLDDDERVARATAEPLSCGCHVGEDTGAWAYRERVWTEFHEVVGPGAWGDSIDEGIGEHIARWDPARVLAEVEAKRRIVTAVHDRKTWRSDPPAEFIDLDIQARVLELLALPYAGRPGYRESWRP